MQCLALRLPSIPPKPKYCAECSELHRWHVHSSTRDAYAHLVISCSTASRLMASNTCAHSTRCCITKGMASNSSCRRDPARGTSLMHLQCVPPTKSTTRGADVYAAFLCCCALSAAIHLDTITESKMICPRCASTHGTTATPITASPSIGPSLLHTVTATGSVFTDDTSSTARLMSRPASPAPPRLNSLQQQHDHSYAWLTNTGDSEHTQHGICSGHNFAFAIAVIVCIACLRLHRTRLPCCLVSAPSCRPTAPVLLQTFLTLLLCS